MTTIEPLGAVPEPTQPMAVGRRCGAALMRCSTCDNAVSKARIRAGEACPAHPDAPTVDGTCRRRLSPGSKRCDLHGGASPHVRHAEAVERAEEAARGLVGDAGWEPITDPWSALADLLGECRAVADALGSQAEAIDELTLTDSIGRQQLAAVAEAYERSLDRLGKLLVDAARLDLDGRIAARRAAIDEAQARRIVAAVRAAVRAPEAGLTPAQRDAVERLAGARLRALASA